MLLGLDISTSITGATVLDNDGVVVSCEAWDTRNKKHFPTLYSKARFIKSKLWEMDDLFGIDKVFIEQPFMFFNSGGSTAKTMSILQRFNGMISWICFDIYDCEPQHISAGEARKVTGVKVKRGENTKKKVLQYLLDNEPSFTVSYTKHGNPKPESYDKADSMKIAKAGQECIKKNSKF